MLRHSDRKAIALKILNALEVGFREGHRLTWKEIVDRTGVVPDTLSRYLKNMQSIGMILHENGVYALNPKYLAWFDGDNARLIEVEGMPSDINTTEDLFKRIDLEFERSYFQYIQLLRSVSDARSRTAAHVLFELTFSLVIEPRLLMIARLVWEKRRKIKLAETEPLEALIRFRPNIAKEVAKQ
jgi:DNA-binding Lrp family transcriptional regulator